MNAAQKNNGFGPLAERRGKGAVYALCFVLIASTLFTFAISYDNLHFCAFSFALSIFSVFLGEVVKRACLLVEEMKHRDSRYSGSWKAVFKATFRFNSGKTIALCMILMFAASVIGRYLWTFPRSISHSQFIALFVNINIGVVPVALYLIGLREPSPIEVSELNERNNKNVADGLAWNYYYGYLKLVLPHLVKRINESEKYRYLIKVPKVFILLPKSCTFPPNGRISDADHRINLDGSLPDLKIPRGGIHEQSYKHTVHRIEMPGRQPYYCIAEYATPLLTLYDMSNNPEVALGREERDQQCMVFVRKLKEILDNDPECRGQCELVMICGDGNNVADILVEHYSRIVELDVWIKNNSYISYIV